MSASGDVLDAPLRPRTSTAELSTIIQRARIRTVALTIGHERVWDGELTPQEAAAFFERLAAFVRGGSSLAQDAFAFSCAISIGGCEPFARVDALAGVTAAAKRQLFHVQVQTWGRWTATENLGPAIAVVKDSVDLLAINVSARDMRVNGVDHVEALIDGARAHGVGACIYLVLDDGNRWPPDLLALRSINEDAITINSVPVYNSPISEEAEESGLLLTKLPKLFRCRERFGLYVDPSGDAYPCTGMMGQPAYRLGNILSDDIESVVTNALGRPDLDRLALDGPEFLKADAEASGHAALVPTHFADGCDFHRRLMSVDALAESAAQFAHQRAEMGDA